MKNVLEFNDYYNLRILVKSWLILVKRETVTKTINCKQFPCRKWHSSELSRVNF